MKSQRIADALMWLGDKSASLSRWLDNLSDRFEPVKQHKPFSLRDARAAQMEINRGMSQMVSQMAMADFPGPWKISEPPAKLQEDSKE